MGVESGGVARRKNLLFLVHVVFVALDLAPFALQRQGRLDHVPQGLSAGLTRGREVVENGQKLMTLVVDVFLPAWRGHCGLHAVLHSPVCVIQSCTT